MADEQPKKKPSRAEFVREAAGLAAKDARQFGLNMGDDWAVENAIAAADLFKAESVMPMAAIMATVHPRALEYIQQAPILVMSVMGRQNKLNVRKRHFALTQWKSMTSGGMRLRTMMRLYQLPLPMRQISARVIRPKFWPVLGYVAAISPSTLAQVIPPKGQEPWLNALSVWTGTMQRRRGDNGARKDIPFLSWCAAHWRDDPTVGRGRPGPAGDMADFAYAQMTRFNPRWTWQQAAAARDRWHQQLATATYGSAGNARVDASPFPDELTVGDYTFMALRSPAELIGEGMALHHCVGSYAPDLISGACRIISVRRDGKRVATAEFRQDLPHSAKEALAMIADGASDETGKRSGWRLQQFKGLQNSTPPGQAFLALQDYQRHVRDSVKLDRREGGPP